MRTQLCIGALALATGSLLAADALDQVKAGAKKLAEQPNYSWKTTVETPGGGQGQGGGRFRTGPTEGKTEKGGCTVLTMTRGDTTTEAVLQGTKGAVKTQEGWQSLAEAAEGGGGGGQPGRGGFVARMLQNYRVPAVEAEGLLAKVKDLKMAGDACAGELTTEGAKELLSFGRRPGGGGNAPEPENAKGSVKFWLKDGVLAKYQYQVQGTMSFNNNTRDIDRTTTVEIKDVGATKVSVPDEAKKKL